MVSHELSESLKPHLRFRADTTLKMRLTSLLGSYAEKCSFSWRSNQLWDFNIPIAGEPLAFELEFVHKPDDKRDIAILPGIMVQIFEKEDLLHLLGAVTIPSLGSIPFQHEESNKKN